MQATDHSHSVATFQGDLFHCGRITCKRTIVVLGLRAFKNRSATTNQLYTLVLNKWDATQFPICDRRHDVHGTKGAACKQCTEVAKLKRQITCALVSQKNANRREVTMKKVGRECIWTARRPVRLDQVQHTGLRFGRVDAAKGTRADVDDSESDDEHEPADTDFSLEVSTQGGDPEIVSEAGTLDPMQDDINATIARRRQALDINFLRQ